MIQAFISRIFRRRHYWRLASFDEVAELYTSRLLTTFAVNIVNLFAAVYLYKLGYSVFFIVLMYGIIYLGKVPFSYVAAKYIAYYGPKHGIFIAGLIRVPSLIAFMFASQYGLPAVIIFAVLQQISATIYDLSYLVDFSKVKHILSAGKEISTMIIVEKFARIISPVIGGAIASMYSPQATIFVACLVFMISAWPLMRTMEPTKTRSKLHFDGFPWRLARSSFISETVVGFDFVVSGMAWTLFLAVVVMADYGNDTYAALGGLVSLGVLASVITAWTFGKMVDRQQGRILLVFGTIANTIIHLFRPFATAIPGVIGVNIANETATSAYAIPFTRHVFDIADSSGFRIPYMMFIEMALNFGLALGCFVLAGCVAMMGETEGLKLIFVIGAFYQLIMLISTRRRR